MNHLEHAQIHLHAAIGALKDADRAALGGKLPREHILDAIRQTEIAWALLDPFHALTEEVTP